MPAGTTAAPIASGASRPRSTDRRGATAAAADRRAARSAAWSARRLAHRLPWVRHALGRTVVQVYSSTVGCGRQAGQLIWLRGQQLGPGASLRRSRAAPRRRAGSAGALIEGGRAVASGAVTSAPASLCSSTRCRSCSLICSFRGIASAPLRTMPSRAITHFGWLGASRPTAWPGRTPRLARPAQNAARPGAAGRATRFPRPRR